MSEHDWLADRFENDRRRLHNVAYRLLGSPTEADDAVQETWIRLSRSDTSAVENLSGWLTTVVARVSLNMLQSRKSRREDLIEAAEAAEADPSIDPEQEALSADSVGLAMLVVLERLTPAERLAFVLHDVFGVPFEEIATIADRSPAAARKLASRARRRIRQADLNPAGGGGAGSDGAAGPHRAAGANGTASPGGGDAGAGQAGTKAELVRAFLAASRGGNFELLLATLDPDIVVRPDETVARSAVETGVHGAGQTPVDSEIRGADAVARAFAGRAWAPRMALIDGSAGLVWAPDDQPRVAFRFTVDGSRITAIDIQGDLAGLTIVFC
ncbi:sigma-70 family RNA polymerase sigma factor [Spirillospora sp. NPDC048819]|uniref:sigma-70 family RNA polymerase sigma factor n=1 Tax=Spirillospora sp. NPDC048819 TaxID=3155268 RepID=UPI00340BE06F